MKVGLVQVESKPGSRSGNLAHALPFIEEAAAAGAELVVLPELSSCGYVPNRSIWRHGESVDGPTVSWMRAVSRRLGIHLGAGLLEADGSDFYNCYAITDPAGNLAGAVRKAQAEAYCFRRSRGWEEGWKRTVETEIGRIGVGICADNHHAGFLRLIAERDVDLVVMPHGSPAPCREGGPVSAADIERALGLGRTITRVYAESLGVPALFVNGVGTFEPMQGLLGTLMAPGRYRLRGVSCVTDSDGALCGELGEEERSLVCDVTLDRSRRGFSPPTEYDGWLHPGSAVVRKLIIPIDVATGRFSYAASRTRRRAAQSCSAPGQGRTVPTS